MTSVCVRQEEHYVELGQVVLRNFGRIFSVGKVDTIIWTSSGHLFDRSGDRIVPISSSVAVDEHIRDVQAQDVRDERKTQDTRETQHYDESLDTNEVEMVPRKQIRYGT